MKIRESFRNAMNWLHTWAGIWLGTMLFLIFWMGTLSVFDREIDQWMEPAIRISPDGTEMSVDAVLDRIRAGRPEAQLSELLLYFPRERHDYFEFNASFEGAPALRDRLHPATGESLGVGNTAAATGFFYPLHYRLLIGGNLGYWIVAFGTIFMMVLLVTGVVIHRKIFTDFFTFRPWKKIGRSSLDLHNITGTVFLPFHFLICLSGFAIFAGFYASLPLAFLKDINPQFRAVELIYSSDDYAYFRRPAGEENAEMLPIAPFIQQAEAIWTERYGQDAAADRIDVHHYGDSNAFVEVRRHFSTDRVEARRDSINFDLVTGEVLKEFRASPVRQIRAWLEGFHQARFDHWTLLWLYFIAGLSGCVLIGTGFVFWLSSRRRKAGSRQPLHLWLVEAMSVGSTSGVLVATAGYFVINRLLDGQAALFGLSRESIEIRGFFILWILTFLHGVARREAAWKDQAWVLALLALAAVLLNWITTGDHLLSTAASRTWSIFGMDLTLIVCCVVAGCAAVRLRRYPAEPKTRAGTAQ